MRFNSYTRLVYTLPHLVYITFALRTPDQDMYTSAYVSPFVAKPVEIQSRIIYSYLLPSPVVILFITSIPLSPSLLFSVMTIKLQV